MAGQGRRVRPRRWAGRNRDLDMDAIRNLAREAADYQDLQVAPSEAVPHRSGFVDVERHAWDWADADPVIFHKAGARDARAEPWRHQWSPFEADVTPWLSPEEREAARPTSVEAEENLHSDAESDWAMEPE